MSVAEQLRERLLAGEPFTARRVHDELGVNGSNLHFAIGQLKKAGAKFDRVEIPNPDSPNGPPIVEYRLSGKRPTPEQVEAGVTAYQREKSAQARERKAKAREEAALSAVDAKAEERRARDRERKRLAREAPSHPVVPASAEKPVVVNGAATPGALFDASLVVNLLKRNDDGTLTIGAVSDEHQFVFHLVGMMPRQQQED